MDPVLPKKKKMITGIKNLLYNDSLSSLALLCISICFHITFYCKTYFIIKIILKDKKKVRCHNF